MSNRIQADTMRDLRGAVEALDEALTREDDADAFRAAQGIARALGELVDRTVILVSDDMNVVPVDHVDACVVYVPRGLAFEAWASRGEW